MLERAATDADSATPTTALRTVADVTGLFVELARACKGLSFYAEGHPARSDLIDRAWMAWCLEVQRAGALEITRAEGGIRVSGLDELLTPASIDELHVALRDRDVETLLLTEDVTRESFSALLDLLAQPAESIAGRGGVAVALSQRCDRGIGVNGAQATGEAPISVGPTTSTSLGAGLLVSTRGLVHRHGAPAVEDDAAKPTLDEDPLAAPAGDDAGEALRMSLLTLDGLSDDAAYEKLSLEVLERAMEAFAEGRLDDVYRVAITLADHAVGAGGRSARQARLAHETSQALCTGGTLDEIIDRACSAEVTRSVRASRVLLQLGELAADRLLARITDESGDGRAAQLRAVLMALGDHATASLERALASDATRATAIAARLCGDTQNPALVPALAIVLRTENATVQRAVVSALTAIGGEAAGDALLNELSRPSPSLVHACSQGLATLGEDRFVLPLLAALDRAERRGDGELALELVRSLGRLGSERAVPRLASMLRRRRLIARGPRLELQGRALDTLAELPGREARRTVEWTAQSGPRGLRQRAKTLLHHSDDEGGDDETARNA